MNNLGQQNTDFEDDDHVQITDLEPDGSRQKRLIEKVISILHKGVAIPWIRYSLPSLLLVVLLGAIFLQVYQPRPITSPISAKAGVTPSVSGLSVQFGDNQAYVQASDGTLTAYQEESGQTLWHTKLPAQTSLQASSQVVYAYYTTTQNKGLLEALNGKNGRVVWEQTISVPGTNIALQQTGDALYVADANNTIYAFQANNGRLRWNYHDDSFQVALPIGNLLLQVQDGIAEISQPDHSLSFLSASDGRKIVQVPPDGNDNPQQIEIDGQLIYAIENVGTVSLKQSVQVFRASDGKRVWSWTAQFNSSAETIVEQDNKVIGQIGGVAPALTALRGSDGHILWTYRASNNRAIISTELEEDGTIYLVLQDNTLVHLRTSDGQSIWSTQIKINSQQFNNSYSFFDNGIVFLVSAHNTPSQNNLIYALRASDGKILWHTTGSFGSPSFQSGILYIMRTDNRIDAWRESDGEHLWSYQTSPTMNVFGNPSDNHNLVFLTDLLGNIEVLRASDGKLLWRN